MIPGTEVRIRRDKFKKHPCHKPITKVRVKLIRTLEEKHMDDDEELVIIYEGEILEGPYTGHIIYLSEKEWRINARPTSKRI